MPKWAGLAFVYTSFVDNTCLSFMLHGFVVLAINIGPIYGIVAKIKLSYGTTDKRKEHE